MELKVGEFGFWAGDKIMLLNQLSPDPVVLKVEIFRFRVRAQDLGFQI